MLCSNIPLTSHFTPGYTPYFLQHVAAQLKSSRSTSTSPEAASTFLALNVGCGLGGVATSFALAARNDATSDDWQVCNIRSVGIF